MAGSAGCRWPIASGRSSPSGARGDGLHSWGPTQPPVRQHWRTDKGVGALGLSLTQISQSYCGLQRTGPYLTKLGTEMDQAATLHTLADKTPTQTMPRRPLSHSSSSMPSPWRALYGLLSHLYPTTTSPGGNSAPLKQIRKQVKRSERWPRSPRL